MQISTTGPDFREEHVLADGTQVHFRHIRPEDADELRRAFDRLSPESRYRRFLSGISSLSERTLHYLTNVDGHDHVAIVATTHASDQSGETGETGLGVARFVRASDDPTVAEAAIAVSDEMQGKGLGRQLTLTLARAARERGIERFRGDLLASNEAARKLLDEVGAVVRTLPDGSTVFEVVLDGGETGPNPFEQTSRRLLRAAALYVVGAVKRLTHGGES